MDRLLIVYFQIVYEPQALRAHYAKDQFDERNGLSALYLDLKVERNYAERHNALRPIALIE